jgi:hypothetical protein
LVNFILFPVFYQLKYCLIETIKDIAIYQEID